MINEKELKEAIAECQGDRNPNANTCIKLASYYTILDHIQEETKNTGGYIGYPEYSYAGGETYASGYSSDSEFSKVTQGMDSYDVMEVMDELMDTLMVINPRLYASVIRKLQGED